MQVCKNSVERPWVHENMCLCLTDNSLFFEHICTAILPPPPKQKIKKNLDIFKHHHVPLKVMRCRVLTVKNGNSLYTRDFNLLHFSRPGSLVKRNS